MLKNILKILIKNLPIIYQLGDFIVKQFKKSKKKMEETEIGVEKLSKLLRFSVKAGKTCYESFKDGKVTLGEAIGMAMLVPDGFAAFRNLDEIKKEIKDIDPDEAKELLMLVLNELELSE